MRDGVLRPAGAGRRSDRRDPSVQVRASRHRNRRGRHGNLHQSRSGAAHRNRRRLRHRHAQERRKQGSHVLRGRRLPVPLHLPSPHERPRPSALAGYCAAVLVHKRRPRSSRQSASYPLFLGQSDQETGTLMRTVGMYLAELLEAYGVDVIFGIPGVHTVELYRGLPNTRLRHITPRHEQGAGFMADGYARVSGRPGVCFIITGPGMTNIATAMAQAYADSIPMLVISAVNALGQIGSGEGWLHELQDQRQLAKQVSAFSHTVMTPAELPKVVARAFADRKSTRLNSSHLVISYAVFCLNIKNDVAYHLRI